MWTVPLILGLLAGVLTSYTDIKTGFIFDNHAFPTLTLIGKLLSWEEDGGEVDLPKWIDKIIIPTAEGGILYYAYLGLKGGNTLLALSGVIGLVVGFILGIMFYYLGAWASGDVVVLAAFSALLPFAPKTASVIPPYGRALPLYSLAILFNSILAVFPFILVYALAVLAIRGKFHELGDVFTGGLKITAEFWIWLIGILGIQEAIATTGFSNSATLWVLGLVLLLVFSKFKAIGNAVGILSLAYLVYSNPVTAFNVSWRMFVVLYTFKVLISTVKYLRTEVLMEEVPVERLQEWDILGETIHELNGEILRDREGAFGRFKRAIAKLDTSILKPKRGRVIASPTAEGLAKEQIEELRKLVEEGKLENSFLRKKAMPFAPALFIGFLMAYFWGDVFWWRVLRVAGFS